MNAEHADIEFLVENTKLPAHKTILAARSAYFRALFYGGLAESTQSEIKLTVPLEAFKALLGFIYNGRISLASLREECLLDTLGLANQYGFESLELSISTYLTYNLSLENCCAILDAAGLYSLEWLRSVCMTFMDRNALSLLKHSTFQTLSQDSLCSLLERDSFFAPEVEIFNSVHEWCKCNPRADIEVGCNLQWSEILWVIILFTLSINFSYAINVNFCTGCCVICALFPDGFGSTAQNSQAEHNSRSGTFARRNRRKINIE